MQVVPISFLILLFPTLDEQVFSTTSFHINGKFYQRQPNKYVYLLKNTLNNTYKVRT